MNDELRQNSIECLIPERELLGRPKSHVDAGVTVAGRRDERL